MGPKAIEWGYLCTLDRCLFFCGNIIFMVTSNTNLCAVSYVYDELKIRCFKCTFIC